MAFFSTFDTDETRPVKVFPTFEQNTVSYETFLLLNFCHLRYVQKLESNFCLCMKNTKYLTMDGRSAFTHGFLPIL